MSSKESSLRKRGKVGGMIAHQGGNQILPSSNGGPSVARTNSNGSVSTDGPGRSTPVSSIRVAFQLLGVALMGILFGMAFVKSRVFEPMVIRAQFRLYSWVMLKMFLAAGAASSFVFTILSITRPDDFALVRLEWEEGRAGRGLRSATLGGAILGIGMSVAGACPGMVLAQVGAGAPNSGITFAGGLCGALVYGLLEPVFQPLLTRWSAGPKGTEAFADSYSSKSFTMLSAMMCAGLVLVVAMMEIFIPWQDDLPRPLSEDCDPTNFLASPLECYAWPPSIGGAIIGFLQLPCFFIVRDFLGSSTGYQAISSIWVLIVPKSSTTRFEYARRFAFPKFATHWQVVYEIFAILGAYVLENLQVSSGDIVGIPAVAAFFGGFLMLWGSRMGAGCTSGHGISGAFLMHLHGWVAVPAMFGAGIICAFIISAVNSQYLIYNGVAVGL